MLALDFELLRLNLNLLVSEQCHAKQCRRWWSQSREAGKLALVERAVGQPLAQEEYRWNVLLLYFGLSLPAALALTTAATR